MFSTLVLSYHCSALTKSTYVSDIDVVEQQCRDADVGRDDEEDEDEDAEEPALLDHDGVGRSRLLTATTFRHPEAAGSAKNRINFPVRAQRASEDEKLKLDPIFVARTSLAGLQSTVMALPCSDYVTEVLDSLLSALIYVILKLFGNYLLPARRPTATTL